jgi:hypothetical protein
MRRACFPPFRRARSRAERRRAAGLCVSPSDNERGPEPAHTVSTALPDVSRNNLSTP